MTERKREDGGRACGLEEEAATFLRGCQRCSGRSSESLLRTRQSEAGRPAAHAWGVAGPPQSCYPNPPPLPPPPSPPAAAPCPPPPASMHPPRTQHGGWRLPGGRGRAEECCTGIWRPNWTDVLGPCSLAAPKRRLPGRGTCRPHRLHASPPHRLVHVVGTARYRYSWPPSCCSCLAAQIAAPATTAHLPALHGKR